MRKRNRVRPAWALLLAAVLALTGPAQSAGSVQAAEAEEKQSSVPDDTAAEIQEETVYTTEEQEAAQETEKSTGQTTAESITETETITQDSQTETNTMPETIQEENTATQESVAEAVSTDEDNQLSETMEETTEESSVEEAASTEEHPAETTEEITEEITEETTEKITEEAFTEEETEEETLQEVVLTAQEKEDAAALTINQKEEFVLRKDEESRWYSFTPEEDGAYALRMVCDGLDFYDYWCTRSGVNKTIPDDEGVLPYKVLFVGEAGETVYFQPYVYNYVWEDYEIAEVKTSLEIVAAGKGSVTADSDGKYILSYNGVDTKLGIDTTSTSIRFTAGAKETQHSYYLGVYCSAVTGSSRSGTFGNGYEYTDYFSSLDINTAYHLQYVLCMRDKDSEDYKLLAWFDGEGMPFDAATKQTDKIGGELHVTADFGTVTVEYELFLADTAGRGAYIRYRKSNEQDWIYEEAYDGEQGSFRIDADSETAYVIELVSRDKTTVYDRAEITTGKYDGSVKAVLKEDSITTEQAAVVISGFDTEIQRLDIQTEYTDHFGELQRNTTSYYEDTIKTGSVTHIITNLEAGTVYDDIKIRIESVSYTPKWNRKLIYSGLADRFTTKEASIKKEDISLEVLASGQQNAQLKVTVNGIAQDKSMRFYIQYRRKGSVSWQNYDYLYLTNNSNTGNMNLYSVEPNADYEVKYRIDGIVDIYEFRYTPAEFTGSVKPEVKVLNTYANGLEVECALNGEVDSEDTYTCRFEICFNELNGWWGNVTPWQIDLNTAKTVKQINSWGVRPGQNQKWRYIVNKNGSSYYTGYFECETKPISAEIGILSNTSSSLQGSCTIQNWADVIKDDGGEANIQVEIQMRKKGQENWEAIEDFDGDLYFNKEGSSSFYVYGLVLEPFKEYELRMTACGNDGIVYGETSFIAESSWDINASQSFIYDPRTNNKQYISIRNNYEKPTVEVENENIVSVREIRQARIYLNVHNMGTTKLYVTADGITKEVTVTVNSPLKNDLYYLEGADTSLADLKLPENMSWVNSSESPKADDENKIQYFDAQYKEGDTVKYASVPVAVGKLGAIDIRGKDAIGSGKDNVYSVYYDSVGADVKYYGKGKAYEITQQWTGNDNLRISGKDNERNVTVTGGSTAGEYELTLTVTVKNCQSGKSCAAVTETKKVRVIGQGLVDNLIIQPAREQPADVIPYTVSGSVVSGTIIEVDYESYDHEQKSKLQMEAKTDTGTAGIKDADVSWENESTGILEVNDTGLVTVKGGGEGRIRVTAKDDGKFAEYLVFKIYDSAPVFDTTSVIVRQGSTDGTRLPFRAQNGNDVTAMKITSGGSKLEIRKGETGDSWYLRVKDGSTFTEETREQVAVEMTTAKKTYTQTLDVTILPKPVADKTAAEFKQTVKPNLFYSDSEAVFAVTSSYEIEEIRTAASDAEKDNFHVKKYDSATGLLTLAANKLSKENVAAYTAKNSSNAIANIEVKFRGFDEYVSFQNIKVAVQNKAVSIKAEDAVVTAASENALVSVLSGKAVYDITDSAVELLNVSPASQNGQLQAAVKDGQLQLTYKGTGTAKYKLKVSNPNWTKDLNLSGKIAKVDVSKLALKSEKTKAILNTTYQETVKSVFSVKGNNSLPVELKYSWTPQTDALMVEITGNKNITVRVAPDKTAAPRKYTLKVWGELDGAKTKAASLAVTVTDKAPAVKLSAKGSINMANRELSGITYTANIKNTDAGISKVAIVDENTLRFSVKKDDSRKLSMKALKKAKGIEKNRKYSVKVHIQLSNGYEQDVTVTVKPVNKFPKLTVNAPKKPVITQSAKNAVWVKLAAENGYEIEKIVLVNGKGSENFTLTMQGQTMFSIQLADHVSEIVAKTYTVKYQVYFAGADNSKPMTKSMKIAVKN